MICLRMGYEIITSITAKCTLGVQSYVGSWVQSIGNLARSICAVEYGGDGGYKIVGVP